MGGPLSVRTAPCQQSCVVRAAALSGHGGLQPSEVGELKQLRDEVMKFRRLVADRPLDKVMLQDERRSACASRRPPVRGDAAESALGIGLHLRPDPGRVRVRRLRDRRIRASHRGLAGVRLDAHRLRLDRASPASRWQLASTAIWCPPGTARLSMVSTVTRPLRNQAQPTSRPGLLWELPG